MTERKVGDLTVCSKCGAPAKYVSLSTFEQYEPSQIQYVGLPPELPEEGVTAFMDAMNNPRLRTLGERIRYGWRAALAVLNRRD